MRHLLLFLTLAAVPLAALDSPDVRYMGGSAPLAAGAICRLDLADSNALTFVVGQQRVSIPYATVHAFSYDKQVAHPMGVIGTVAVVMIKYRQRRHYLQVEYKDEKAVNQAAVFELPKDMVQATLAVLRARVKMPCSPEADACRRVEPVVRPSTSAPASSPAPAPANPAGSGNSIAQTRNN